MTGGLVLGEALNLFIPAEQMIFGLAVWLLFFVCVFAHRKSRYGLPVFLFVAGMFAGVLRMGAEQTVFSREEEFFREEYEDGVVLQGTVQSVKEKDGTLEVVLKNCETEDADGETLRSVLCYLNEDSEFPAVGEKIRVFGEGKAADPARNPGVFDHQLYCRAKGISGIIYADGYTGMGGKAHIVSDSLYRIRRQLSGRLKLIALPEDAGILSAVLLGEKEDLDSAVYELYRKNGISHLLAISGLHISIVGLGIWKLFRKGGAGFWISGIFAGGFLIAYGMMVGSGPSVVRAVSMAGLSFLAAAAGRTYDLPTAMCIPALGLLLTHPYLLTQASFQLSFLAVISLVYPGRLFSARGETFFTNEKFSAAASAFFVSLSLQMVTAPVVCWHSFGIPVYGVFLNLLVIPLMTYVVLSGFIGLGGAHYILKLYEVVCNGSGKLPGAELVVGQPEVWKIGCYYGLVVAGAIIYERGMKIAEKSCDKFQEKKHRLIFLCAAWLLAFFFLLPSRPAGLSVTFLDVGQGDGIVLRFASRTILVDCGSSQQKSVGEKVLVPYLRSQGVTYVDLAVMTHGDQDHINGIRYLLEHPESGIRLGGLMMPKAGNDEIYGKMAELAKEQEIPVYYAAAGDRIENIAGKGMYMECLSPDGEEKFSDRNEESLVFRVTYDRFYMMLMGDLETGGEENLVESGVLSPVTVLKAGHHGSATSSGENFLEKLSPEITVLSYGRKNRYGHPAKEVKERLGNIGSEILETGISGAVMIETDGKKMKVRTMLPPDAD